MGPILVTGATGNVGSEVIRALSARGLPVRAAVRSPEKARAQLGEGPELVAFDFARPETFGPACQGAGGLFLMRPPAISKVRETLNALVDAAASRGVEQVVFLSVAGAESNRWVPHHAVEQHLLRAPVSSAFLRAGFFAQNLEDAYLQDLREEDRLYVPAGQGRVTFVDVRDLAEVTALAFSQPDRGNRAWTLTGGEAVGFEEVARLLSEALGRPIRYEPASIAGYLAHLRRRKLPWAQAMVQTVLHLGLRFGNAAQVDPTLGQLLGRAPRTMADYVRERAPRFARAARS